MAPATKVVIAVLGLLALGMAAADCPNACSGHGTCQSNLDYCICYNGYQGNDCSQRTCPFGLAFVDVPKGDLDHDNALTSGFGDSTATPRPTGVASGVAVNPMWRPNGWWENHPSQLYGTDGQKGTLQMAQRLQEGHFYAECSSRGLCDHETGICSCFTGYEGAACNRTVCANDCSGHGTCQSIRQQVGEDATVTDRSETDYMLWDADKTMGCVCDPEYFGVDCSKRRCYRNDDPLTTVTTRRGYSEELTEQGEVQIIKVGCSNGGKVLTGSSITVTYTDVQFGESYTTSSIDPSHADAAANLQAALRALPNQVLSSMGYLDYQTAATHKVTVTRSALETHPSDDSDVYYFMVTFHESLGDVPTMTLDASSVSCAAGWTHSTDDLDWAEEVAVSYATGYEAGPLEDMRIQFQVTETADADDTYKYCVATGTSACSDYLTPATATVPRTTALQVSALMPVKFMFSDATTRFGSTSDVAVYTIQFKASSADTDVYTKFYSMDTSVLPIAYKLHSRGATSADDILYVDYVNPNDAPSGGQVIEVTSTGTLGVSWKEATISKTATTLSTTAWTVLDGCTAGIGCDVQVKLGASATTGSIWEFTLTPGSISCGGGDQVEYLTLAWAGTSSTPTFASAYVEVIGSGDNNYRWVLNGINMGTFAATDISASGSGPAILTGADNTAVQGFTVVIPDHPGTGKRDADTSVVASTWDFSILNKPDVSSYTNGETLNIFFFSDAEGSLALPTANLAFVFNLLTTSTATDTYRWKLSTDEYSDWHSSSNFVDGVFELDHDQAANDANLAKIRFEFTAGADNTARSCDSSSTAAYYYVQMGMEGINDFATCSDRGICDEDTGLCKCFKGYAGQDCSEQHALSM